MTDKQKLDAVLMLINPSSIVKQSKPVRTNTKAYVVNKVNNDLDFYLIFKGYKKILS